MKLNESIIRTLQTAVENSGGVCEFAKRCGMDPANISRYLNGKVKSVSDDNWNKLERLLFGNNEYLYARERREIMTVLPVTEWKALLQHHKTLSSGDMTGACRKTGCGEVPIYTLSGSIALRVSGVMMEPVIRDGDIIIVRVKHRLEEIPDNRIVVAALRDRTASGGPLVCKRVRRSGGVCWFASDNPRGDIFQVAPENIAWLGLAVHKISEL